MADDEKKEDKPLEDEASSQSGAGTSASDTDSSEKNIADSAADELAAAKSAEDSKSNDSDKIESDTTSTTDKDGTKDNEDSASDSEQMALPGMPEQPAEDVDHDPHHDDPHHQDEDHEGYHDEYQDDHYYHDENGEYHHDEHHDDHHYDGYHDDHAEPQHSAYDRAQSAALTTGARSGPLDQNSVPDYEPELDEFGNPYGGPVKPFLDHLEDLRWTILKCVFALLIAMLGCMMGAKYLVSILIFPLSEAKELGYKLHGSPDIPVMLGPRTVGRLDKVALGEIGMDTNAPVFNHSKARFAFVPVPMGTNYVLALKPVVPEETKGIATSFEDVMVELKNYGPFQSIWLCLQLALYGGLVIGAPFIIFFVAEFVLPALKVNEKKFLYKAAGIGSILFMLGVAFCYFLIVQVALRASVEFSNWLGFGADEWNASEYLGFVIKFLLVMGLAFEMPVVLLTIVKIGILDYKKLIEFRSYFVVGMLVASAVITPSGDPFTMTLVAIPLWILYEICVIIARIWYKKEEAAEIAAEAADSEDSPATKE